MTQYALIMLATGVGIPLLAALNAALGQHLGSPAAAAVILFAVAFLAAAVAFVALGAQGMENVLSAPKHLFLGGFFVVFYVLSVTYIAPHFGIGNAVFFVLLGQLISAATIDHFGLFGAQISPLSMTRASGIFCMAIGVWLAQRA